MIKCPINPIFQKIYLFFFIFNKNSYSFDMTQSIIDQIFTYIDKDQKYRGVKELLEKRKVVNLLKDF